MLAFLSGSLGVLHGPWEEMESCGWALESNGQRMHLPSLEGDWISARSSAGPPASLTSGNGSDVWSVGTRAWLLRGCIRGVRGVSCAPKRVSAGVGQ